MTIPLSSLCSLDPSSIPGLGRVPWRRKWVTTPIFLSWGFLRGPWQAMVHVVAKSWTWLIDRYFSLFLEIPIEIIYIFCYMILHSLWLSWWIRLQCRRPRFNPWVGKIPWRRKRLPTSVLWLGEFHGLYSPWGCKELDTTERLSLITIVFSLWSIS